MVWIQTEYVVHKYVLDHCDTLHLTQSINTGVIPIGLALTNNSQGRMLLNPINTAIAHLIQTQGYNSILNKRIRLGTGCATKHASEDQAITLYNMGGVFIMYGALTFLSFVHTSIQNVFGDTNASCEDDKVHKDTPEQLADQKDLDQNAAHAVVQCGVDPHAMEMSVFDRGMIEPGHLIELRASSPRYRTGNSTTNEPPTS